MSSRTSPALPAFSYAQAAKGLSPAITAAPTPTPEQGKNTTSRINDRKASASEPSALDLTPKSDATQFQQVHNGQTTNGDIKDKKHEPVAPREVGGRAEDHKEAKSISNEKIALEKPNSMEPGSPSFGTASSATLPKEEGYSSTPNGTSDSTWDKQSQSSAPIEKASELKTDNKTKDADDDWEKVSVPAVPAEKELKAAPLPSVNIWQQRKEAQDAKRQATTGKTTAAVSANPKPNAENKPQPNGDFSKPTGQAKGLGITEGMTDTKNPKKSAEVMRTGPEGRKLSRNARVPPTEKGPGAPPPVADAASWPTPENAILEEKKPAASHNGAGEKIETAEDLETKSPATKTHSKEKWVKVDHVPSVKWQHFEPPTSRRGGRGGRGGRDGTGRGGHVANDRNVEKSEKSNSMAPPAMPRPREDRGAKEGPRTAARSNSVPVDTARASYSGGNADEKPTADDKVTTSRSDNKHQNFDVEQGNSVAGSADLKEASRSGRESRRSSKPLETELGYKQSVLDPARSFNQPGDTHSHPRMHTTDRRSMPAGYYTQNDVFGRESEYMKRGEFNRTNGETVSSWRDRDRPERREPRSERGRGGYRGRGSHNNYQGHGLQNPSWTTPLPQHGFVPTKSQNGYSERHRQSSAPYTGHMQSNQSQRSSVRSQSIPTATAGYHGVPGLSSQPMSPTYSDFQSPFYGMGQNMVPQVPYAADFNTLNTMKLVQAQIEYYFSIENLCKDLFLRRHMDGQGYVALSFIARFKRLQQLTDDMNLIRETCAQTPGVEFVRGDDNIERLRRREGWGQWIMDFQERDPSAQNDGPKSVKMNSTTYQNQNSFLPVYNPSYTMSPGADASGQHWANGHPAQYYQGQSYDYGRNQYEQHMMGVPIYDLNGAAEIMDVPEIQDDMSNLSLANSVVKSELNGPNEQLPTIHPNAAEAEAFVPEKTQTNVNGNIRSTSTGVHETESTLSPAQTSILSSNSDKEPILPHQEKSKIGDSIPSPLPSSSDGLSGNKP